MYIARDTVLQHSAVFIRFFINVSITQGRSKIYKIKRDGSQICKETDAEHKNLFAQLDKLSPLPSAVK